MSEDTALIVRIMRRPPPWRAALYLAVAGLALPVPASRAQEAGGTEPPPGPRLGFSVSAGLEASDNPDFSVTGSDASLRATSRLGVSLSDETPLSRLSVGANAVLRQDLAGDSGGTDGLVPSRGLSFDYERDGATAGFSVSGQVDDSRIDYLRPLVDFIDEDGVLVPPDDFEDLTGEGWRRRVSLDTSLTLGRDAPIETELSAGLSRTSYRDTTAPTLDDSRRAYGDIGLTFALSEVTDLDVGLRYSTYRDSDQDDETISLRTGLTLARPAGALSFRLEAQDTSDGERLTAQAGRSFERPWGRLDTRLGVTRAGDGELYLSGRLSAGYDLPNGRATAAVSRSVASGDDDEEELRTTASLGYVRELTPRADLSLDLTYFDSETTGSAATTDRTEFGIDYGYALTRDWDLNAGYNYRMKDESPGGRATENLLSVTLSRDFDTGF